ncbi:unnamed protein product [Anisakis simplex]|uniref:Uncharacterized protein n=1 Tax=Anisakis simplex TaxID=6269 RepID=A0A3P6Q263_ANISI|nr:unnamed protein product [Anisakis simplex]
MVVFWIAFVILILGTILFVVLASGDVQPWAILRKPTTRRTTMMQRLSMRLESNRGSAFDIAEVARKLSKLVSSRSASLKDDDTEN